MKVLLVEDEIRMTQALAELLRLEGYEVETCVDGLMGMEAIKNNLYDIIILDVMLPKKSGFEIVKEVRALNIKTPVLLLTAKSDLDDKVKGLDSGADDYLTKPFMSKELLARIRALGRRCEDAQENRLEYGDLVLDMNMATLFCSSTRQSVALGGKELRILAYLMRNKVQILTREQLATKIWGYDNEAEYNNVEVYMSFTRKKLSFLDSKTEIKAVRGLGYRLRWRDV